MGSFSHPDLPRTDCFASIAETGSWRTNQQMGRVTPMRQLHLPCRSTEGMKCVDSVDKKD